MNAALGPGIVKLDEASVPEEMLEIDPSRLVHGAPAPVQAVRNGFTDATGRFFGGIWRSSIGAWRVAYTENELCVLTEGRIRVSDDHGRSWTFGAGDCFVIPAGFRGLWEVLEPARKFYAIFEPPSG
jgi:Predicted enzyme of the cupin superfamily